MSARLTALHEHYRKKRYNHRVVFGQPLRIVRRGWRSRYAVFAAGQVFGYERWPLVGLSRADDLCACRA